jgi:hypothetical protein
LFRFLFGSGIVQRNGLNKIFCPNQNQQRPKHDFFVQIKINTGQNQQAKWEEHGLAAARACWATAARAGRRTRLSTSQTFFSHAWINV